MSLADAELPSVATQAAGAQARGAGAGLVSLQLRVLSGMHEGAVVPLTADLPLTLASSGQSQVLLRDAPGAAELHQTSTAWLWREPDFEHPIEPSQAWCWGEVVLALAPAEQPWPETLPELIFSRPKAQPPAPALAAASTDKPEPQAQAEAGQSPLDAATGEAAAAAVAEAVAGPQARAPKSARASAAPRAWRLLGFSLLGLGLVMLVLLALLMGTRSSTRPPATGQPMEAVPPVNLALVNKAIADLGLSAEVKAKLREDGRLIVRGVVPENEQLEALTQAVARYTRRYTPLLLTQPEFERRIQALQLNLPEGIQALSEPGGLLVLQGQHAAVNWPLARQLADSELPEAVAVSHRVVGVSEVQREWRDSRQALGLSRLGSPTAPAAPENTGATAAPRAPAPVPPPALPEVAVVVGGPRPYLVLAEGGKWLPGGKIKDVELESIDNQFIVFKDSQGRAFQKPR